MSMVGWILACEQVCAVLLAAGAGYWYSRLGTNWDYRLAGPLVLSFMAFVVGTFAFGNPAAAGEFQLRVWLVLGGAVLAGVAAAKLLPARPSQNPDASGGTQTKDAD
jgi:hypothetical protein